MKALFLFARFDLAALCVFAALVAGCSLDASQLRPLSHDGAIGYGGATADTGGIGGRGGTNVSTGGVAGYAGVSGAGDAGLSGGESGAGGTGGPTTTAASIAPAACVPGASALCYCPTGQQGAQTCASAGTFAACVCVASAADAGGAGGSDGAATRSPDAPTATGGTTYSPTGGGYTYASTSTPSGGGNHYASTTITSSPPTGGTTGVTTGGAPSGTTVTFASGKAQGAMTGYGWANLGIADAITDPTCGTSKTAIRATAPCLTSTNWNSPTALCISGTVPALGTLPDYTGNWGVSVGVNASDATGGTLGQSFSSITIAVSGSPSSGLRAMVHRRGDPDATSFCYALTPGTAIPLTSFSTTCYTSASPGTAITAADVPNIDKISVQVSSGTAAITVSTLCITGITFAK